MNIKRCPACGMEECAAYMDGHCVALIDNDFGGKKCPFFKTKAQNDEEIVEAEQRLANILKGKQENKSC